MIAILGTTSKQAALKQGVLALWERVSSAREYAGLLALCTTLGAALSYGLWQWTSHSYYQGLERVSQERLDLYESTLRAALDRFDYLPFIVAGDQQVQALLNAADVLEAEGVNKRLQAWQQQAGAAVLYLMDTKGQVLASSNWQTTQSFVGKKYDFRPYFLDGMAGRAGRFFAIGFTTRQPGFFLSYPVRSKGEVIGVAVVKVDMAPLEKDWAAGGENVMAVDRDGVVFLASDSTWKYRSLQPLSDKAQARIDAAHKYKGERISSLTDDRWDSNGPTPSLIKLRHNDQDVAFYIQGRGLGNAGWTLYHLMDTAPLGQQRRKALLIGAMTAIVLLLIGVVLVLRRRGVQAQEAAQQEAWAALEGRVRERTQEMNISNERLREEIHERSRAEADLRQTQEELIQAAKLAALGQMSAGIVHEINQPIAAMQTFLASSRLLLARGDTETLAENLEDIDAMLKRMGVIVSHLKSFASKSKGTLTRVAVDQVVDNALLLLEPRIHRYQVELQWKRPDEPVYVHGDEIRLEQILINLLRNALDAMKGQTEPQRLSIEIQSVGERTCICIADTGPGIAEDDLPRVFDPFFTTKPTGEGMGLGLSVSYGIAREFGGDLSAVNLPERGAAFRLLLDPIHIHLEETA